jgi:hypothetical protein
MYTKHSLSERQKAAQQLAEHGRRGILPAQDILAILTN